jgi:hypothetical protein
MTAAVAMRIVNYASKTPVFPKKGKRSMTDFNAMAICEAVGQAWEALEAA